MSSTLPRKISTRSAASGNSGGGQTEVTDSSYLISKVNKFFADFNDEDFDFNADPEMWQKIGIKKPRRMAELNKHELDKIYLFNLQKDVTHVRQVTGGFHSRNQKFLEVRESDPEYMRVARTPTMGAGANFPEATQYAMEESWRATTVPYGFLRQSRKRNWREAAKGFTEEEIRARGGVNNISQEELRQREQKFEDDKLWNEIKSGKHDVRKKDDGGDDDDDDDEHHKESEQDRKDRLLQIELDAARLEQKLREDGQFALNRKLPTRAEFEAALIGWDVGHNETFDTAGGFPAYQFDTNCKSIAESVLKSQDEQKKSPDIKCQSTTFSSKLFIKQDDEVERLFQFEAERRRFKRAVEFLRELERLRKKLEKRRKKREKRLKMRALDLAAELEEEEKLIRAKAASKDGVIKTPGISKRQARFRLRKAIESHSMHFSGFKIHPEGVMGKDRTEKEKDSSIMLTGRSHGESLANVSGLESSMASSVSHYGQGEPLMIGDLPAASRFSIQSTESADLDIVPETSAFSSGGKRRRNKQRGKVKNNAESSGSNSNSKSREVGHLMSIEEGHDEEHAEEHAGETSRRRRKKSSHNKGQTKKAENHGGGSDGDDDQSDSDDDDASINDEFGHDASGSFKRRSTGKKIVVFRQNSTQRLKSMEKAKELEAEATARRLTAPVILGRAGKVMSYRGSGTPIPRRDSLEHMIDTAALTSRRDNEKVLPEQTVDQVLENPMHAGGVIIARRKSDTPFPQDLVRIATKKKTKEKVERSASEKLQAVEAKLQKREEQEVRAKPQALLIKQLVRKVSMRHTMSRSSKLGGGGGGATARGGAAIDVEELSDDSNDDDAEKIQRKLTVVEKELKESHGDAGEENLARKFQEIHAEEENDEALGRKATEEWIQKQQGLLPVLSRYNSFGKPVKFGSVDLVSTRHHGKVAYSIRAVGTGGLQLKEGDEEDSNNGSAKFESETSKSLPRFDFTKKSPSPLKQPSSSLLLASLPLPGPIGGLLKGTGTQTTSAATASASAWPAGNAVAGVRPNSGNTGVLHNQDAFPVRNLDQQFQDAESNNPTGSGTRQQHMMSWGAPHAQSANPGHASAGSAVKLAILAPFLAAFSAVAHRAPAAGTAKYDPSADESNVEQQQLHPNMEDSSHLQASLEVKPKPKKTVNFGETIIRRISVALVPSLAGSPKHSPVPLLKLPGNDYNNSNNNNDGGPPGRHFSENRSQLQSGSDAAADSSAVADSAAGGGTAGGGALMEAAAAAGAEDAEDIVPDADLEFDQRMRRRAHRIMKRLGKELHRLTTQTINFAAENTKDTRGKIRHRLHHYHKHFSAEWKRLMATKRARKLKKVAIFLWHGGNDPNKKKEEATKHRKNSLLDKFRKHEDDVKKAQDVDAKNLDELVEQLYDMRRKENALRSWIRQVYEMFTGIDLEDYEDYLPDDLIDATRYGDYGRVIDIIEHVTRPIGPNEPNAMGMTAFYAAMEMLLRHEVLQPESTAGLSLITRLGYFFRKKIAQNRLDWVVKILQHKGGDINYRFTGRGDDGLAMIHRAAMDGACDMMSWLLMNGADPNLVSTTEQRTALMYAVDNDKLDATLLLLEHGAMRSLNQTDKRGWTALHYAAVNGSPAHAQVLMICGAKVTTRNNSGRIPAEEARARGRNDVVSILMSYTEFDTENTERMDFYVRAFLDNTGVLADGDVDDLFASDEEGEGVYGHQQQQQGYVDDTNSDFFSGGGSTTIYTGGNDDASVGAGSVGSGSKGGSPSSVAFRDDASLGSRQ